MQFKDVVGQTAVKNQLVNMVQQNRLSHALLFLGKEGCGALSVAIAFAQYIVCSSRNSAGNKATSLFPEAIISLPVIDKDENDSCGVCPACIKSNQLIHPDIHFSFPVVTKKNGEVAKSSDYIKPWREFIHENPYGNIYDWLQFIAAENKQGNITAKECEEINHIINLKSFESRYKILIMWMPEFLGREGNKLLKLIEEPPPDTVFIFVAQDEGSILSTILSRTQLVKIPALSNKDIEGELVSKNGVSDLKAKQISAVCEGNYREALQIANDAEEDWQGMIRDWLNTILKTGPAAQVKWIEEISKLGREKQKQFLYYFIYLLQQALRIRVIENYDYNSESDQNLNKDHDFATRLNKLCSHQAQEALINELDKSVWYIERNANAKMLFHALTIRLYHIIKYNSVILIN